jgi:hypothetical protein
MDELSAWEGRFLDLFPKSKLEFEAFFIGADDRFVESDLEAFARMVELRERYPTEVGRILAVLAANLDHDADAPTYVQYAWIGLCEESTDRFVEVISALSIDDQEASLRFMSENIHGLGNEMLGCVNALENSGYEALATRAKQFVR